MEAFPQAPSLKLLSQVDYHKLNTMEQSPFLFLFFSERWGRLHGEIWFSGVLDKSDFTLPTNSINVLDIVLCLTLYVYFNGLC